MVTHSIQESRYARSLIEASLDPLFTISPEGKITDINNASIEITEVTRENLIGTDFFEYFTEPDKACEIYKQVVTEGFEATEYIHNKMNSQIPIIALTAYVSTADLKKYIAAGMNDFISKPPDEKLLYGKILNLINWALFEADTFFNQQIEITYEQ